MIYRPDDRPLDLVGLPTQGKPEREHLYLWIWEEEKYVHGKFDDQRQGHDDSLRTYDLSVFWERQVTQYLDRAKMFLEGAREARSEDRRHLEQRAQQAMAKGMMTHKGLVESSIRVFGSLPQPGLPSGEVRAWE